MHSFGFQQRVFCFYFPVMLNAFWSTIGRTESCRRNKHYRRFQSRYQLLHILVWLDTAKGYFQSFITVTYSDAKLVTLYFWMCFSQNLFPDLESIIFLFQIKQMCASPYSWIPYSRLPACRHPLRSTCLRSSWARVYRSQSATIPEFHPTSM